MLAGHFKLPDNITFIGGLGLTDTTETEHPCFLRDVLSVLLRVWEYLDFGKRRSVKHHTSRIVVQEAA
jgi:hypothetical protein